MLGDGAPRADEFEFFIRQDGLYLGDFATCYAFAITKTSNHEEVRTVAGLTKTLCGQPPADHPAAEWIGTYAVPEFERVDARLRERVDVRPAGLPEAVLAEEERLTATVVDRHRGPPTALTGAIGRG